MLRKFRVSNFKNFEKDFELDLTKVNGYNFNSNCIKNNIINNAIIYGHNGVGKTNLALAIFDIIILNTDKYRDYFDYKHYQNAFSESKEVEFYYEFLINSNIVVYEYKKTTSLSLEYEKLTINNVVYAQYNRNNNTKAEFYFEGTESLNTNIPLKDLSIIRYIRNNSVLANNEINRTFYDFISFIENMLYFRSLNDRTFIGMATNSSTNIFDKIIYENSVEDFELFLNECGIECKLEIYNEFDTKTIGVSFNGKLIPFNEIASSGTDSLSLFYFWYLHFKNNAKSSFVIIDEFDAFYHFSLSKLIIEKLKTTGIQFILTTHNTSNLTNDLLRPDCYFLMDKQGITSLSNRTPKELREAHNIEKMYKAGSFNV